MVGGAASHMGDHELPKRSCRESWRTRENDSMGRGGKEKQWTDCVAEYRRMFGITGDWNTAELEPGVWYTVQYSKGAVGLWPRG